MFKSPVYNVIGVPIEKVRANSYNPNAVAPAEMKLLYDSIKEDGYTMPIVCYYLKDEDIDLLYSDRMNRKEAIYYAEEESNTLYFLYSKENVGSAFYYKDVVEGIILLSAFPCGTDSLVNELAIRKLKNIPCINIILDDSTSTLGLYTRLESFVDIIKLRHDNG